MDRTLDGPRTLSVGIQTQSNGPVIIPISVNDMKKAVPSLLQTSGHFLMPVKSCVSLYSGFFTQETRGNLASSVMVLHKDDHIAQPPLNNSYKEQYWPTASKTSGVLVWTEGLSRPFNWGLPR